MHLKIIFGICFLCLASAASWAATAVTPAAIVAPDTTVEASLITRLVGNAPPGNITVTAVTAAVPASTQSGFVNNVAFGSLTIGAVTTPLSLPATGIILTNGNISGSTTNLGPLAGDADVGVAVGVPLASALTSTSDAAVLSFSFTVATGMTSVSLDAIFATNETIGAVQGVRDAAVIIVDGTNYGKFANGDPLSNLNTTDLAATAGGVISGFTNVSSRQTIIAPLNPLLATHTIKIAIADHHATAVADPLRDSCILLANMQATAAVPAAAVAAGGTGVTIAQGIGAGPVGATDTIAPRLKLVGNKIINVMQNGLYLDQGAIAYDNVDGNLTTAIVVSNPVDTTNPALSPYTVTYNVTDAAGNAATTLSRTVNVIPASVADVLPPVVTAPADILITANDFQGVANPAPAVDPRLQAFFNGVSANDGIVAGAPVPVTGPITHDSPAVFPIGKTLVTFAARDAAGNQGFASATVTVVGTNQTKVGVDADADGMPDAWEMAFFGNLITATATPAVAPAVTPTISDFDADGLNDLVEWQLGTNPRAPNTNQASVSTDSWSVVFSNNPSDTDGDGVIDALEDASSVLMASKVTGLPVSISSNVKYTIEATGGQALDRVHVDMPGAGAPANILTSFGVLSFRVNSGGVNIPVRITSSVPFGTSAQFYKVNAAGVYTLIPLSSYTIVNASTVEFLLTDGGPLDLDAVTGTITDPIAIGSAPQVLGGSGPSGGCSIAPVRQLDPLLPALVLLALLYLLRRRYTICRI